MVEPHLGKLTSLKASIPHPKGRILVNYKIVNSRLKTTIVLPMGMEGTWKNGQETVPLNEGVNTIN
jgi:hypothetical protein